MPSLMDSDFVDLDLEGGPEEVVEASVVVQLSSTSKTIWSKTVLVLRVVPTTSTSSTCSFFQYQDRRRQGWPLDQRRLRGYRGMYGLEGRGAPVGPSGLRV